MSGGFDDFLILREAAARAYVAGDPAPVLALSATKGTATFFDPGGGFTTGAEAVNEANASGAALFAPSGTTRFEIEDRGEAGDLAFWTGFQVAEVEMRGGEGRVSMRLRVTEVFRRSGGEWRMVHRHASPAREGRGQNSSSG